MIFKVLTTQRMGLFSDISIKNVLWNISVSIKEYQAYIYQINFRNLFLGGSYNLNSSSNTAVSSLECNLHKAHFTLRKEEPCDHRTRSMDTTIGVQGLAARLGRVTQMLALGAGCWLGRLDSPSGLPLLPPRMAAGFPKKASKWQVRKLQILPLSFYHQLFKA